MINNRDKHDGHVTGEPEKPLFVGKNASFSKYSWACYVPKRMLGWSGGGGSTQNEKLLGGLPSWLRDKASTGQCRRRGLKPWSRKTPRALDQLSPCTTTSEPMLGRPGRAATEPTCPRARASRQEKLPPSGACTPPLERSPCSLQPERSRCSDEDPAQPEINK